MSLRVVHGGIEKQRTPLLALNLLFRGVRLAGCGRWEKREVNAATKPRPFRPCWPSLNIDKTDWLFAQKIARSTSLFYL